MERIETLLNDLWELEPEKLEKAISELRLRESEWYQLCIEKSKKDNENEDEYEFDTIYYDEFKNRFYMVNPKK